MIMLVLSVPFFLTACKGDEPRQPAAVVKKRPPRRAKAPVIKTKTKAETAPLPIGSIERNPFKPFTARSGGPIVEQPKTPLQRYQVGQFKLVAVIWGIDPPVGMVETPDGKGYVVRQGDLIGDRNGRVARIKRDRVVVVEKYKELSGKLVTKKMEIKLPSSKERGEAQ